MRSQAGGGAWASISLRSIVPAKARSTPSSSWDANRPESGRTALLSFCKDLYYWFARIGIKQGAWMEFCVERFKVSSVSMLYSEVYPKRLLLLLGY
eukprot:scaffold373_cov350-Pavlova_lutheri.AAC.38